MNKVMNALVEMSGNDAQWKAACEKGVFYVIATPVFGGTYSVGCMETPAGDVPGLEPTMAAAEDENNSIIAEYRQQIVDGERDDDDEWDGEVMEAHWDGESAEMHLYSNGQLIYSGDWRDMAGLG